MTNKQKIKKSEEGKEILNNIISWINNVDNKISIILAFMVVFLGFFVTTININLIDKIKLAFEMGLINVTIIQYIKGALILALYITSTIAILLFLKALLSKINIKKYKQNNLKKNSNIFFGSIAKMQYKDYLKEIFNQTEKDKLNDIYSQIYINSIICFKKFKYYNCGIYFSMVTIIIFIICKISQII